MRFVVVSDSHGDAMHLPDVLSKARGGRFPVDGVLFLGDGIGDLQILAPYGLPIIYVRGNCDYSFLDAPSEETVRFEGKRIFMTHGHHYDVKWGLDRLVASAAERGADIVLFGHTHLPTEKYYPAGTEVCGLTLGKPIYAFNPGSLREARGGYPAGFGVLELTGGNILWSHVPVL